MRLKAIEPIIGPLQWEKISETLKSFLSPTVGLELDRIDFGPSSIESEFDITIASPFILEKVKKAEKEGIDGIFIDCFGDPAVEAARELVKIPVTGAFQPSMAYASVLGQRLGILTVLQSLIPLLQRKCAEQGWAERVVSIRSLEIPVLDLGSPYTYEVLFKESLKIIEEDKADVIVLGCTGLTGLAAMLQKRLKESGYLVPVIDPAFVALRFLESCLEMELSHSKLAYPYPPQKERALPSGFILPE